MKRISILLAIPLFSTNVSFGQSCNCEANFKWIKQNFEVNDAGYQYAIDRKGMQSYEKHNKVFLEKVKLARNYTECTFVLNDWLKFFRPGHLYVSRIANSGSNSLAIDDGWERENVDEKEFEKYLDSKKEVDYEGIWETKAFKLGIKKKGNAYVGFVLDTKVAGWKKGDVKLKIYPNDKSKKSVFYYNKQYIIESDEVVLLKDQYIQFGSIALKRLRPQLPDFKPAEDYYNLISATRPYLESINETTLLFRIPSFWETYKKDIDSIIVSNKSRILQTENLIIDIRNNGGGNDVCYYEIMKLLYTNPIRKYRTDFLSTKQNNQVVLDLANSKEPYFNDEVKKWAKELYENLNNHLGEFVKTDAEEITNIKFDTVYAFPRKVAIIINEENASTAEQFLLDAKQSRKVKLFGRNTFGAVDVSNVHSVDTPSKEFRLGYSMTKTVRAKGMPIDGIGIQPDYYIESSVPQYEWVNHVTKILTEK